MVAVLDAEVIPAVSKIVAVVFADDHETILFGHRKGLAQSTIDSLANRLLVLGRFAAPQIDPHQRHFYTSIITGFSISALNAPMSCAPSAPSTER